VIVATGRLSKVAAYGQLAKVQVYQHFYEWLLVVAALELANVSSPGMVPALALLLLATFAVQAATCATDDVMGYRDSSDAENRQANDLLPKPRKLLPKPLLTGLLTEREAMTFAALAAVVATVAMVVAIVLLGHVPVGVLPAFLLVLAIAVQYSWGAKLSYRPGGLELVIVVVNMATILLPYWAIAHGVSTLAALLAGIAAGWFLLVVSYGNAADRAGDASADRRTIAVVLGERGFLVFLAVLHVVNVVLLVLPFALDILALPTALCILPLLAMQAAQVRRGLFEHDYRRAMALAFRSIDGGAVGLALAIVLS
jgi:1,4-dihydroxy-2-naphthoate polyprenyltransferase